MLTFLSGQREHTCNVPRKLRKFESCRQLKTNGEMVESGLKQLSTKQSCESTVGSNPTFSD